MLRKRADRKDRKANEDRVKVVVDLLGRLQALADFQGSAMKRASLFQKGPSSSIQQAFLKQDATSLSAMVFNLDGLTEALRLGLDFVETQAKEWAEDT